MSNVTISPNMGLPIPTVAQAPGPDWATNIDASLSIIDGHNHSNGSGVQVTPSGINISADLPFNGNNAISLRSAKFTAQGSPLSNAGDVGCIYESGVDLYYNDGSGNQIQITKGGSVTGATGTITGLPSGTASASFSAGTFTFESATSTPANMNVGPITIGDNTANSFAVTLSPNSGIAANYSLNFPAAGPVANQVLVSDGSGNLSWTRGLIPLGSVIATFPGLSGAYTTAATTAADANGYVLCAGQTISDASSPMTGAVVPNINNSVFLQGSSTGGNTGGANSVTLTPTNLPAHTHAAGTFATSIGVTGGTATLSGVGSSGSTFAATGATHTHNIAHSHVWAFSDGSGNIRGATSSNNASTSYGAGSTELIAANGTNAGGANALNTQVASLELWTTGVAANNNSGTGNSAVTGTESSSPGTIAVAISSTGASATGSNSVTGTSALAGGGSSFSILPNFISAVYLMRVK